MRISTEMIRQIAEFEGCRLVAYRDVAGVPTIGIGHTGKDVLMGDKISLEEAYRLFRLDVAKFENAVNVLNDKMLASSYGQRGLSQRQFDALVSLVYNTGAGAIGPSSTMYKLMMNKEQGNYAKVCHAFMLWVKITDPKTGKKVVCGGKDGKHGLVLRRATEAAWYVYGCNWQKELEDCKITDVVVWAQS